MAVMLSLAWMAAGLAAGAAPGQAGQEIPVTKGQTFADKEVSLPSDVRGKVTILVIGFSKSSKVQTGEWGKHVAEEFGQDGGVTYYQMPVLESVPRMMRGMVTRSIRNGTAPEMKEHMLPVFEKEEEWKTLVKFSGANDAYVVVLDREGKLAWSGSGKWTEERFATLRTAMAKLKTNSADR